MYVDITEGSFDVFQKATNIKDTAYDKLVKELEKHYTNILRIYGKPSNVDGNGKIEIVFHETEKMKDVGGYFNEKNINPEWHYSANMDVLYINSKTYLGTNFYSISSSTFYATSIIIHELNYGMLIPLRLPLVNISLGIYTDIPKEDNSIFLSKNNYYDMVYY